jgi:oxygen-independent coproporphyrinogen III oxidase
MAGIYLHIPFCKQACHYCDFHFSTSLNMKEPLLKALESELIARKDELQTEKIQTIYFGGGTPSILKVDEIKRLMEVVFLNYNVENNAEITLEANPDDLTKGKIKELRKTEINRFSIGVQSFFEDDLRYMNRAHTSTEAETAIKASQDAGFENLSVDLIYGTPTLTDENWIVNLRKMISYRVAHLSCYALTVEDKTPLSALIKREKLAEVDEVKVADQFFIMLETLRQADFEQYEISNFAKLGFRSKHNSSYWSGQSYLGIGPGAHSFNGKDVRRWNISNNAVYIRNLKDGNNYFETETLSLGERFNEMMMTQIRLIKGVSFLQVKEPLGSNYLNHIFSRLENWNPIYYLADDKYLALTDQGKIMSDQLASDLFMVD